MTAAQIVSVEKTNEQAAVEPPVELDPEDHEPLPPSEEPTQDQNLEAPP